MTTVWTRRAVLGAAAAALSPRLAVASSAPVVAAASDLSTALPEIAGLFQRSTGRSVRLSFGSSGALTQQILNGAPFEVFLSADEAYVQRLAAAGKTLNGGAVYAIGSIGLYVPRDGAIATDHRLQGLASALARGRVRRFAIANPAHAPYGRAARQALQTLGLWTDIQPRLVLGESVAQAAQFALSGSAQGGILPASMASRLRESGLFTPIAPGAYTPLRQRAVCLKQAGATARAFYDFLGSPAARAVFRRHGFGLPPGR